MARALANDPPILVADEPTGNLDTETATDVFQLLQAQASAGKTVIVVTHDRDLAAQVNRTITLVDGRIVKEMLTMTINASWRKAFRDVWENKARALLVILALVVGIVSVGTAAVAYSILPREMDKNYLYTDPASATLWVEPLDDELVQTVADHAPNRQG